MKLNFGTLILALLVLALCFHSQLSQPWTPWRIAGLAIAAPALVLFVLARLQLGNAFSVQAKASTLVTAGLYSRIRNPIYVFGGLLIAGIFIFLDRPWWLLVFVVLIPLQALRVRKEERVLEATFGDAYRGYKRQTWF
ncbi:MAG TPA: isoprenylcysteine carboxylmethyltransferase family protein [Terriglobales bacterium]|nr:isoprenylcysteine carboxylmethyltransferase family protein [Terriglobales bacterium]